MPDLSRIAAIPNVAAAVLGDLSGGFLDAVREEDGEAVAAVVGFLASGLARAGEDLGLGPLARVAVAGERRALAVAVRDGTVVAAQVDSPAALAAVERALEAHLGT